MAGWNEALLSLLLVVIAVGVTFWWKIPVQKEASLGAVRGFIQLVAVGYALKYIFAFETPWLMTLTLLVMITVGAQAAAGRVKKLEKRFLIAFAAIACGSLASIGAMLLFQVIPDAEARGGAPLAQYVIPLAGMIVSNSMNAAAHTVNRLTSDIRGNRLAIETGLALGWGWRKASLKYQKDAAVAGMISILNFFKTVGIVALPGAMTGMILAGADPLHAVLLQVIVGNMLLLAVSITTVVALELTVRRFFTGYHQLR